MKTLSILLLAVVLAGVCPSFTSAASAGQYETFFGYVVSIEDDSEMRRVYLNVDLIRIREESDIPLKVPCIAHRRDRDLVSTLRSAKDNTSLCRFYFDRNMLHVIGPGSTIRKAEILKPVLIFTSSN